MTTANGIEVIIRLSKLVQVIRDMPEGSTFGNSSDLFDTTMNLPVPQLIFYIYDHLGNTRVTYSTVVDCEIDVVNYTLEAVKDYYPYAKILREYVNGVDEKYISTQHERDKETGLDYRGARFYDGDIGRFLSLDPLAADFPAWSDYNYVMGNPVMLIDPDGRSPIWYPEYDPITEKISLVKEERDNEQTLKEWANGVFSDKEVSKLYNSLSCDKIDLTETFIGDFVEGFKADEDNCNFNCFNSVVSGLSAGGGWSDDVSEELLMEFFDKEGYSEHSLDDKNIRKNLDKAKPFQSVFGYSMKSEHGNEVTGLDHVSLYVGHDSSNTAWVLTKDGFRVENSDGSLDDKGNRYNFQRGATFGGEDIPDKIFLKE